MCIYDDMRVQVSPVLTVSIIKKSIHEKSKMSIFQKNILKILGFLRLWTFVVLLLNPVYAIPLKRAVEIQSRNSHRHKEGIGIQALSSKFTNLNLSPNPVGISITNPTKHSESSDNILASVPSSSSSLKNAHFRSLVTMDTSDLAGRSRRSSGGENAAGTESSLGGAASHGSWMDPCSNHNLMKVGSTTQQELSYHIMKSIVEANSQVQGFISDFSNQAFGVSWKDVTDHKAFMFEFLKTGNDVDLEDEATSFEDKLQEAYELMQRRAVGIEQVTLDQALYQSSCLSNFRQLERRIIGILCQLRHAMMSKNVVPRENVTKDIMPESARSLDSEQSRNIRDAVILREYIDSLHLLHSVFENFSQK